jgi:8-oxo-dGTP diphosphatase
MKTDKNKGMKKIAAMCILQHGQKYLLLERSKPPFVGYIVPVGGKLEPYESPQNAVIREVFEETGLKIDAPRFCGLLTETSPIEYNWIVYIYIAEIQDIEPPFCDEGKLVWVKIEDLPQVLTPPTDAAIYEYVAQKKHFFFDAIYNSKMELISIWEIFQNMEFKIIST